MVDKMIFSHVKLFVYLCASPAGRALGTPVS